MLQQNEQIFSHLFPAEYDVLQCLWELGDLTAAQLSGQLHLRRGWHRNTTYTVLRKCIQKGFLERREPHFQCHALVTKEQVRQYALARVNGLLYGGDTAAFAADVAAFGQP